MLVAKIRKAIVAGIGAMATGLVASAVQQGNLSIGWAAVGSALGLGIASALAVWKIQNKKVEPGRI